MKEKSPRYWFLSSKTPSEGLCLVVYIGRGLSYIFFQFTFYLFYLFFILFILHDVKHDGQRLAQQQYVRLNDQKVTILLVPHERPWNKYNFSWKIWQQACLVFVLLALKKSHCKNLFFTLWYFSKDFIHHIIRTYYYSKTFPHSYA